MTITNNIIIHLLNIHLIIMIDNWNCIDIITIINILFLLLFLILLLFIYLIFYYYSSIIYLLIFLSPFLPL